MATVAIAIGVPPVAALRLKPDVLAKCRAPGKGCAGIMASAPNYVAENMEILRGVHGQPSRAYRMAAHLPRPKPRPFAKRRADRV